MRWLRLSIVAALLVGSATQAFAERPWLKPEGELQFSEEALSAWDERGMFKHNSRLPQDWKAEAKAAAELRACLKDQPHERCTAMVLKGWFLLREEERAPIPAILDRAERAFEVDPLTISGDQRLPADVETAVFGLVRLRELASATASLFERENEASVRRQLAFEVAHWRAGGTISNWNLLTSQAKADPKTGPFMRLMEVSDVADNSFVPQEKESQAEELRRTMGPLAASNLALVRLSRGLGPAAETAAREGFDAVRAAKGADSPQAIAAALILARVLQAASKSADARAYARIAYEGRRKDRFATTLQRIDAAQMLAEVTDGDEKERLEREALTLIDQQLAAPTFPVIARFAALPTISDVELDERVAKNTISDSERTARRALNIRKSRLLTSKAFTLLMRDPVGARSLLEEAAKADAAPMVRVGLALLRYASAKDASDLFASPEFLNLEAMATSSVQPEDHPDRILSAWLTGAYYQAVLPTKAPHFARQAVAGAAKRLTQHRELNESAMTEITGLRPIFISQVQVNWTATQALPSPGLTAGR